MPSPSFAEARSPHQKVRAAGLHPDYWYPVEYDDRVRRGQVVEVRFWGRSIALYRGSDGRLRALENRCAHRQLPLSLGDVTGCALTCAYHGWSYRDDGRLSEIPHELFGQSMPAVRLGTYPVRVRYGLIWLFPGNPALAERRAIPEIPELEGPDRWAYVPIDFTWRAHHSMVMDNLCDLTHAYLHRRFPSFRAGRLLSCESEPDRVVMRYEARVGPFAHLRWAKPRLLDIAYEYPYHRARFQWSNIEGAIAYWTFLLPVDERATRVFFVFCYDRLRPDFSPLRLGHGLVQGVSPADPARRPASARSGWLRARSGAGGMGSPLRAAHPGPQPGRRARRAPDDRKVGSVPGSSSARTEHPRAAPATDTGSLRRA